MQKYDVIIIGAGPGGLNTAKFLEKKYNVLILESKTVIGPKICAGGLFNHGIEYLNLPTETLECSFSNLKLYTKFQKVNVNIGSSFIHTIKREKLAEFQMKNLSNTKILKGITVSSISPSYVIANGIKFGYNTLIGADGSNSIVRRYLGLDTRIGATIQYKVPGNFKNLELHFLPKYFGTWYSWIFPGKDYAMIGCGSDPRYLPASKLKENFRFWLKSRRIDVSNLSCEGFPISWLYKGHSFGNIFLVGDAAGFASSITGEGIFQAMISGEQVARQILGEKTDFSKLIKMKKKEKRCRKCLVYRDIVSTLNLLLFL